MMRILAVGVLAASLTFAAGRPYRRAVVNESHATLKHRSYTVEIKGMQFRVPTVTAAVGDTIIWRNADILSHSATSARNFDTREIKPGAKARWVVSKRGTFAYMCVFHSTMRGVIVVK